jgi:hypothetical protein
MMLCVQKQITFEAFNCGEVLQLSFLPKRKNKNLFYYQAEVEKGASTKKPSIKTM